MTQILAWGNAAMWKKCGGVREVNGLMNHFNKLQFGILSNNSFVLSTLDLRLC